MRRPIVVALLAAATASIALPACTTYRDDLARSQRAFEENQHERALALLRMLEPDTGRLDAGEQARYAYLRGMTDYRIGYKADARHWLSIARAMDEAHPGMLATDWRGRVDQSLAEIDPTVWADGMEGLETSAHHPAPKVKRPPGASDSSGAAARPEEGDGEPAGSKPPPKKKKKPITEDEE